MPKIIPIILGVLLVATSTNQMEGADAHSVRRAARAPHPATQKLRDAFGSQSSIVQPVRSSHSERHELPASTAFESKSCDTVWCYEN
jgi:hypothetical protein